MQSCAGSELTTVQILQQNLFGCQQGQQGIQQTLCLVRMVGAKIANVHIQRGTGLLRPGMYAQVRLGQQHSSGHTAGAILSGRKGVRQLVDGLQTCRCRRLDAPRQEPLGIGQPCWIALAAFDIGSEV